MGKKTGAKKKVAAAPVATRQVQERAKKNPLFEKRTRNFRIGGDIQPKRDLTRFTRWPQYVRLQRQKRILLQRIKVPPSIAQFQHTAEKNQFAQTLRLFNKYKPETGAQKRQRLQEQAAAIEKGETYKATAPDVIKFGVNHVTELVEQKKAQLVLIAHDVDPIELVLWLPCLCRKKDVPYMIVKGKSRLGQLVGKKTATCVALTKVRKEDVGDFNTLCKSALESFNENLDARRKWGGGILGVKSQHTMRRYRMMIEKEEAKKLGMRV